MDEFPCFAFEESLQNACVPSPLPVDCHSLSAGCDEMGGSKGPASFEPSICHAFRVGLIFNLTKIDRWFLVQIKEIVDFEEELASVKN